LQRHTPGVVQRHATPGLLSGREELRQGETAARRQRIPAGPTFRRAHAEAVESAKLQGARVATRNVTGGRPVEWQEVSVHRAG